MDYKQEQGSEQIFFDSMVLFHSHSPRFEDKDVLS